MGYLIVFVGIKILEVFDNGLREKGERKRMFITVGFSVGGHISEEFTIRYSSGLPRSPLRGTHYL